MKPRFESVPGKKRGLFLRNGKPLSLRHLDFSETEEEDEDSDIDTQFA